MVDGSASAATVHQVTSPDPLKKLPQGPALLVFGATWCAPWQLLGPALDTLTGDGVDVRRIDIDTWPHHAESYRVISVPTFVVVRAGKEVRRRIGATGLADLRKLIGRR
jgi:thioredoxin 1